MYLSDVTVLCYKNTKCVRLLLFSKGDVEMEELSWGFSCSNHECLLLLACQNSLFL